MDDGKELVEVCTTYSSSSLPLCFPKEKLLPEEKETADPSDQKSKGIAIIYRRRSFESYCSEFPLTLTTSIKHPNHFEATRMN